MRGLSGFLKINIMKSKFYKSLCLVIAAVLCRSIYLHQEFYYRIWEENLYTVLFIGAIFMLFIFLVVRIQKI